MASNQNGASVQGNDKAACEANMETDVISNAIQILDDACREMRAMEQKLNQQRGKRNEKMWTVYKAM